MLLMSGGRRLMKVAGERSHDTSACMLERRGVDGVGVEGGAGMDTGGVVQLTKEGD